MARRSAGQIQIEVSLGLAKVNQGISELKGNIDRGFASITQSITGRLIAANQGLDLLSKGFNLAGSAVSALSSAIERGQAFAELDAAFKTLYGSTQLFADEGLGKLREAVNGTISDIDLLKEANTSAQAGLSPERFLALAKSAETLGDVVKQSPLQALESLTKAMESGNVKSLRSLGIIIDQEKAYKSFAKELGVVAEKLNETGQKEAVRLEILEQVKEKTKNAGQATRTAGDEAEQASVAWDNLKTTTSRLLNEDPTTTSFFRGLTRLAQILEENIPAAIQTASRFVVDFNRGLNRIGGWGTDLVKGQIARQEAAIADKFETLRQTQAGEGLTGLLPDALKNMRANVVKGELDQLIAQRDRLYSLIKQESEAEKTITPEVQKQAEAHKTTTSEVSDVNRFLKDNSKELAKARADAERIAKAWNSKGLELQTNNLEKSLSLAAEMQDKVKFDELLEKYRNATNEALSAQITEDFGKQAPEWAQSWKSIMLDEALDPFYKQFEDKAFEVNDKAAKDWKEKHDKAASEWTDKIFDALSGNSLDWQDAAKNMGAAFGGEIIASLGGGEGVSSFKDIGSALGKSISGALSSAITNITGYEPGKGLRVSQNADGSFVYDNTSQAAMQAGANYSATASQVAGYTYTGAATIGAAMGMEEKNKVTNSQAGTGQVAGTALGGTIGAYFGGQFGASIGSTIGGFLGEVVGAAIKEFNAGSEARHTFANWMEDLVQKNLTTLAFRKEGGGLETLKGQGFDYLQGQSQDFSRSNWAQDMTEWGDRAFATFVGLGEALEEVAEISEDVGGTIGFQLGKQLLGNVDNARLLVKQLGLSFEELSGAIEKTALSGEIRWAEFNVQIAGIEDAFKPGLVAIGDFEGAVQDLVSSGGRGMAAVVSFKNVAVEAMEAGLGTIDELRNKLLTAGVDPGIVEALVTASSQAGIQSLQQWAESSDLEAGRIVGNMEALSGALQQNWVDMSARIEDLNNRLDAIPRDIVANIKVNVDDTALNDLEDRVDINAEVDAKPTTQLATGGVVMARTFAEIGEAGAEAVLPLSRVNGKLGVSADFSGGSKSAIVINVDARGASRGAASEIRAALSDLDSKIGQVASSVIDGSQRGYW